MKNQNETAPRDLKLFLLIGQSNMAGRGVIEAEDQVPIPGVWVLDAYYHWIPAVDPLHFDKANAGVGPGRSFARYLAETCPGVQIGLIPCAYGGTKLEMWQPDRLLYKNAVMRTRHATEFGELAGILWHQGEGDAFAADTANSYAERLGKMLETLRGDLDAENVPFIAGTLGDFIVEFREDLKEYTPVVNRQIMSMESKEDLFGVALASGLGHKGDGVHFSAEAQRELGRRYAKVFLELEKDFCSED